MSESPSNLPVPTPNGHPVDGEFVPTELLPQRLQKAMRIMRLDHMTWERLRALSDIGKEIGQLSELDRARGTLCLTQEDLRALLPVTLAILKESDDPKIKLAAVSATVRIHKLTTHLSKQELELLKINRETYQLDRPPVPSFAPGEIHGPVQVNINTERKDAAFDSSQNQQLPEAK